MYQAQRHRCKTCGRLVRSKKYKRCHRCREALKKQEREEKIDKLKRTINRNAYKLRGLIEHYEYIEFMESVKKEYQGEPF